MLDVERRLIGTLPRDLLLDLTDMSGARAQQAFKLISEHTDLSGKNARGAEGQVRYRLMEKGFQDTCELHGGVILSGGVIPGTDLRCHQPYMRFEGPSGGVILGLASMPGRRELPVKNMSRAAGVTLNYHLTPRLVLDSHDLRLGDIFILFLVARDPAGKGRIDELAIGEISSDYNKFSFYIDIERFMASYITKPTPPVDPESPQPSGERQPLITLRRDKKAFKAPEASGRDVDTDSKAQG